MPVTYKVSGLRDIERDLIRLGSHTSARAVGRRVLKKAGKPIADKAAGLAPDNPATGTNDLKSSIAVSTKLNKRQRRAVRKGGKNAVEVYVGTSDPAGLQQEFGNINHPPQSFLRPAWAATKLQALHVITQEFKGEIRTAVARIVRRKAKGK